MGSRSTGGTCRRRRRGKLRIRRATPARNAVGDQPADQGAQDHRRARAVIRSRPIRATASGEALLRAARQIKMVVDDAARTLAEEAQQELQGVALAVIADSLSTWLPAALAAVDPPVRFDLRRADETRTAELLRDGSVTAAVTALSDPLPGCTSLPLGSMRYRPRAAADFAERWFGDGATTASLARAPSLSSIAPTCCRTATCAAAPGDSCTHPVITCLDRLRRCRGASRPRLGHGAGSADQRGRWTDRVRPQRSHRRGPLLAAVAIEFGGS